MYVTIDNIVGEKRIDLAYPIWGKEIAVVSMFSDNVQYQIRKPLKVLLITNEEKMLSEGMFMDRELNLSARRKVIMALDADENVIKTNKLADVTEMIISLDELDNTDNLKDRRISNVLFSYHVTDSEEFTRCEPITPV